MKYINKECKTADEDIICYQCGYIILKYDDDSDEQAIERINNISIKICENVSIENIINPIKYLSLIKDQVSIFSLIEHKLKNHFDDDTNVIFKEKINENENFIEIKDNYDYFLICQVLNIDLDEIDILI